MTVNNETGVIQPIKEIAKIIRHARAKYNPEEKFLDNRSRALYPLFHTDACQGAIHLDLNVEKLGVDILTLDGSKVYGPRGVGCLYVKRSVIGRKTLDDVGLIQPINFGGGQERGIRSGTENVSNIAGFAEALRIIYDGTDKSAKNRKKEYKRVEDLRNKFIVGLQKIRSDITVNGFLDSKERGNTYPENFAKSSDNKRLFNNLVHPSQSPHILSITIPNIDNEFLLFQLDAKGIACSTKSACLRDEDESYVLKAMGVNSRETMRFSLGRWSKNADITRVLRIFGDSDIIPPTC